VGFKPPETGNGHNAPVGKPLQEVIERYKSS